MAVVMITQKRCFIMFYSVYLYTLNFVVLNCLLALIILEFRVTQNFMHLL